MSGAADTGDATAGERDAVRVVLGMPLYNNVKFLAEAIKSIRAQTYSGFVVVMLDDCSTDKTEIIAGRWVRRDDRFSYVRSNKRLGMAAAWRRVYELARIRAPGAQYFAWVSDHDRWDPEWLATLLSVLDGDRALVLAYPRTVKIAPRGTPRDTVDPAFFATVGISDPVARWDYTCQRLMGAGNMIYGLFRIDILKQVGVFRGVLLPDRLLLVELALLGQIRQVGRVLWYRRYLARSTLGRQRGALFGARGAPWWTYLPWWFVHAVAIWRNYTGESTDELRLSKRQILGMSARYARSQFQVVWRKRMLKMRTARIWAPFRRSRVARLESLEPPVQAPEARDRIRRASSASRPRADRDGARGPDGGDGTGRRPKFPGRS